MRGDLVDVLEILPVQSAPTDPLVGLGHFHLAHLRSNFVSSECLLVESSSPLDILWLKFGSGEFDRYERV